MIIPVSLLQ